MRRHLYIVLFGVLLAGCGGKNKMEAKGPAKHYRVTGRVVSVNAKEQSASIDAAAIPDYMEAMQMDYPIADKSDFDKLQPGDRIEGTLDVYESGDYTLGKIKKQAAKPDAK